MMAVRINYNIPSTAEVVRLVIVFYDAKTYISLRDAKDEILYADFIDSENMVDINSDGGIHVTIEASTLDELFTKLSNLTRRRGLSFVLEPGVWKDDSIRIVGVKNVIMYAVAKVFKGLPDADFDKGSVFFYASDWSG